MSKVMAVWRKEMTSQFVLPSFYGTAAVFLAVAGLNFWKLAVESAGGPTSLSVLLFGPMFFWVIALALITALTMRTFAEEKRTGTLELLMTAPLREVDLVGGKFLAALTLFALVLLPVAFYPSLLRAFSTGVWESDKVQVAVGLAGVLLMGSFYTATGVLVSCLSRNPVLSAIGSFSLLCVLFFLDAFWYAGPAGPLQRMLDYVSAIQHVMDFSKGVIDTRAVLFYLSGTGFMLFAAVQALELKRWR